MDRSWTSKVGKREERGGVCVRGLAGRMRRKSIGGSWSVELLDMTSLSLWTMGRRFAHGPAVHNRLIGLGFATPTLW